MTSKPVNHKAGFVNIIGKPNVGKSTLLNALVGEKLAIITPKVQTTRHRIKGIVNSDDYQIVFSDTPGIIKPAYLLQNKMMSFVEEAMSDADILLFVIDATEEISERIFTKIRKPQGTENEEFRMKNSELGVQSEKENSISPFPSSPLHFSNDLLARINALNKTVILIINKIDLIDQGQLEQLVGEWETKLKTHSIIPVSAKEKFNTKQVLKSIISNLPEAPPFFPKEQLTDLPEKFFVAEIIREKIFMNYQKEIPYSTEVQIELFKEEKDITRIYALIITERETQKAILIGHRGAGLKRVGTQARKDIEKFLGKKVYLELFIKVRENWRKKENYMKEFGYGS